MDTKSQKKIIIIDAVMGVGKSTWVIEQVRQRLSEKFVIVVPLLSEVDRYEVALRQHRAVFAPNDSNPTSPSIKNKTDSFKAMLQAGTSLIITTHALFSLWDSECFEHIHRHGYTLVLDETVDLVEETQIAEKDYQMLINSGYIKEDPYGGKGNLLCISRTVKTEEYDGKFVDFIKQALLRNLIKVNGTMYIQTVKPENISMFSSCFVLTYLFPGSQMDCWCRLYGMEVSHRTLKLDEETDELTLVDHDGTYSGKQFKDLITLVEIEGMNSVGAKGRRSRIPLSNQWFKRLKGGDLKKLQNGLTNMARHLTKKFVREVVGDETTHLGHYFMWSTKIEYQALLERDLPFKRVPSKEPICFHEGHREQETDRECFVAHNQRATNNYSHKACLAYLTTPLPRVPIKSFFTDCGLNFDNDTNMLSTLLQWVWRSRIRDRKEILLYIPSETLRERFKEWLSST